MEIIGGLATVILVWIGMWQLLIYNSNQERIREEKFNHLFQSEKFRNRIKKENINSWKVGGYEKDVLNKIIKDIERDDEAQREINKSIELKNIQAVRTKGEYQKRNFFAFQNIEIIKELDRIKSPITKLEISNLVLRLNPNLANIEVRINELIENRIVEKDSKTELYKLSYIKEVYHPYELDENGNQKILFALNFRGERIQ